MEITSVTISQTLDSISLTIIDAANVTSLLFWNQDTYKDFSKVKDFTSKLTGNTTQVITISLSDIEEPYYDGVYFFEAQDNNEISMNYAYKLTRYRECILDKIMSMKGCNECLKEKNREVVNGQSLLSALEDALEERFIDEIVAITSMLDKICESTCNTCGEYTSVQNENNNENFNPTEVALDGGSLD